MQILDRAQIVRAVNRQCGNDFRRGPHQQVLVVAVGGGRVEQVAVLGPDPLGVAVRDRREQQELLGRHLEPLFADPALAQQHTLATVEQRVHHRAPLLERGHVMWLPASRATTSGRRSGGTVFGGWRRGGRVPSNRVVVAVTSATAASNASALAADGRVMPLTLRTYWRAAAAISSAVAAGCNPRSSVMLRHMPTTIGPPLR